MSLRKTVVFIPAHLVQRYQRLARQYGMSRSHVLRMAVETGYDSVRQILLSRTAQRAAEPEEAAGASGGLDAVLASLRNAAAVAVRVQPTLDAPLLRAVLVEEAAKHPGVTVPDEMLEHVVEEFADPDAGLTPMPGEQPPS